MMNSSSNSQGIQEKNVIAWFADNHVAANILMLLLLVGGVMSVLAMRTETFPSIDPRLITVRVTYPGATPYEVEDAITSRVEEELIGIDGVERISSTANEGVGVINVELEDFANADDVYNDVETAVNGLVDFPPEDAERPIITKVKVTPNVLTLALHGDVSEETLKYWIETIEDDMRQLDNVALTTITGIRENQISIDVSEEALRKYALSLEDVGRSIEQFSIDTPAGTIESEQGDTRLRIQEKRFTGQEFEQIAVKTLQDGSVLRLADVATVVDGFEDVNLVSKFNGERAAFIEVRRNETEDTLTVANAVKDYIRSIELPHGLQLSLQNDQTVVLQDRISLMLRNGILGFMLVFLVLLLFLDLKLAFWTSIAIPVSFLGGLMIINFLGYSINMITLFALIVVLGIVVDDAIVTGESIFDEQNKYPNDPNAVLRGVKSVIAPVTVGVTTTIAAFAPLMFSTGTFGQIVQLIPIVVIPILVISLLEAYFILPSHLSSSRRWSRGIMADIQRYFDRALQAHVKYVVTPVAKLCISWRYATLAAFIGFAVITATMVSTGIVRFIFFPAIEGDEITISVTMPEGTPFSTTERTMLTIEDEIYNVRERVQNSGEDPFQSITVTIGQNSSEASPGNPTGGGSNIANNIGQIKIQLIPSDFRQLSALELESRIRDRVANLPNIETIEFQSSPVGGQPDVEVELTHPQEEILIRASEDLKKQLNQVEGTVDVADSFQEGKNEYVFELNEQGYAVGLTPAMLGAQLRSAFFGLEAQRFQRGSSEIVVYVRYPKDQRESLYSLEQTRIRLADGTEAPLKSVVDIQEQIGYSQIQTVDGRRVVTVTSDVDYDVSTPNEVMELMSSTILPNLQNRFTGLSYSFEGESREQAEDLASLGRNMLIALLLIFVLLGAQLRSYTQPMVIMTAIPFGVVGAVWGHYLLNTDLTFISLFGIVALTGVVVNDSVVLMDYLNRQRSAGYSAYESTILAIQRRFRPILLTTMTTSLGLLPMLLETSIQARFLIPMVISLAMGIVFATVVILILVSTLVMIIEDIKSLGISIARLFIPSYAMREVDGQQSTT